MAKYVLVHGAWHGGWCWEKIVPLLKREGHEVEALDLPGHGNDNIPVSDITLQSYVDKVCQALDASSEPVILAGHSMGGIVITQTAEMRPDKIKALAYVTAFLLQNGQSLSDIASADTESMVTQNMVVFPEEGYCLVKDEAITDTFYGDCSKEDAEKAISRLVKQPLAPLGAPMKTTSEKFGSVPRYYIECLRDRAITHEYQKRMYTGLPCQKVFTIDTDHSPFYSEPDKLASALMSIK